jgi:hypothetical protein
MRNENLHVKIGVLERWASFSLLGPLRRTKHSHLYGILKTKITGLSEISVEVHRTILHVFIIRLY